MSAAELAPAPTTVDATPATADAPTVDAPTVDAPTADAPVTIAKTASTISTKVEPPAIDEGNYSETSSETPVTGCASPSIAEVANGVAVSETANGAADSETADEAAASEAANEAADSETADEAAGSEADVASEASATPPPIEFVGPATMLGAEPRFPTPEEQLAMAGQHMAELGALSQAAFALVQNVGTQAQSTSALLWQLSQTIRHLIAVNQQHVLHIQTLQGQLDNRPTMPPLPRSAQLAFDDAEIGAVKLCEHCISWHNVMFNEDEQYTQIFCRRCCEMIAAHRRCRDCEGRVYVDALGAAAPYCKDCAKGHCSTEGCDRAVGGRSGLCDACFRLRPRRR